MENSIKICEEFEDDESTFESIDSNVEHNLNHFHGVRDGIQIKEEFNYEDCELIEEIPKGLQEGAERLTEASLPEKSKGRYEKAYETYCKWCGIKGIEIIISEEALFEYFHELKVQGKKASSLWSVHSMLRAMMNIKHNIDISRFSKLVAFLKKQNIGYKATRSSVLTQENIDNFINNAPNEYLPQKVALIIGVSGACRCEELLKMKITDIDFLENKIVIVIPGSTITFSSRSFVICKPEWIEIINQYKSLRKDVDNDRFFLQVRDGKMTKQPFGHNAIGSFPRKIAMFLKLNDVKTFTGHCFRRTAATLLVNTGGLKRLGAWKSNDLAEGYLEKIASTSSAQSKTNENGQGASFLSTKIETQQYNFNNLEHGLTLTINSHDNSNVTININTRDSNDRNE